ncbi:MAG TPA: efflux RND transporter periplasmic adaptor subunit [Candidatus Polarisedimenticolaceae bacterium]|nr:efflux RND transporter periplasmic adaptor subunit [Candidatus Polarisedimenticolaceae bacterium]
MTPDGPARQPRPAMSFRLAACATVCAATVASGQDGPPPALVVTEPVVHEELVEKIELIGSVAPIQDSLVAAEVEGRVALRSIDRGDQVDRGQLLVRLDAARLEQELARVRALLVDVESQLELASIQERRARDLFEQEILSQGELDQALAARRSLDGRADSTRAAIASIEVDLDRSTIRAPFDGIVTDVGVEIGEWVDRGAWIVRLTDLDTVEIRLEVPEQYFRQLRRGASAPVAVDAYPGLTLDGRVFAVVPQADPEARTFPVLVRAGNPEGKIGSGMLARVMLILTGGERVLTVPKDAIVRQAQQEMLWIVDGGVARPVSVRTGRGAGTRVEVTGNLSPGDLVVVRGNERLSPGQPVIVETAHGDGRPSEN